MTLERPLRLFVAIELPGEVQAVLDRLVGRLRTAALGPVRWLPARNVHLTLKFLGNVPARRVDRLAEALRQGAQALRPFELELSTLGVFPDRRSPRVVWLGLGGDVEALRGVRQVVERRMEELGFPAEARPFSPHLTLARVKGRPGPQELARLHQALDEGGGVERAAFRPAGIAVMESRLTPSGAVYRRLREIPFGER